MTERKLAELAARKVEQYAEGLRSGSVKTFDMDGKLVRTEEVTALDKRKKHDVEAVIDRVGIVLPTILWSVAAHAALISGDVDNGVPLTEDYLYPGDTPSRTPFEVTVPEGRLWVMGDHRSDSLDSRAHLGDLYDDFVDQLELVKGACHEFDAEAFLKNPPKVTASWATTQRLVLRTLSTIISLSPAAAMARF